MIRGIIGDIQCAEHSKYDESVFQVQKTHQESPGCFVRSKGRHRPLGAKQDVNLFVPNNGVDLHQATAKHQGMRQGQNCESEELGGEQW